MKRPKCKWCGKKVPEERVYAALSRGKEPKYCSDLCRGNALTARYRAGKRRPSCKQPRPLSRTQTVSPTSKRI